MTTTTETRSGVDLDALRAVAEHATPGPWGWRGSVDGLIELRGPGTFGPYDARIVSAQNADPCIVNLYDEDDPIHGGGLALTSEACEPCREFFNAWNAEDHPGGPPDMDYRCPKPENLGTVWVNYPGHGHITPINDYASAEHAHRHDVGPGGVDHPNARFIETFNPATVLALLDEIQRLRAAAR